MKAHLASVWKSVVAVATFVAGASLASAQASLPLVEHFNYPTGNLVGNTIAGGTWQRTGTNTSSTVQVLSGSLAYSGLPASQGNKVQLLNGSGYEDPGIDVASTTQTVYASFILNVVNPGTVTTGDYIFNFSSAGTGSSDYRTRVYVQLGTTSGNFKLGLRHGSSDTIQQSNDLPVGTPVFVVVAYNFAPGDDSSSMWINPVLGQTSPPSADLTATASQDLAAVGRVNLRQGGSSTSQVIELDELRVSTSWTDVTPTNAGVDDWTLY
ncbi:MAG: hypothetical protein ACP5UB_00530 [Candidatus Sumerlaeaceae bacterium]